jgi:hypothetical protein
MIRFVVVSVNGLLPHRDLGRYLVAEYNHRETLGRCESCDLRRARLCSRPDEVRTSSCLAFTVVGIAEEVSCWILE